MQAVCYANLVMGTTLPIPLSSSLTAERRELLFPDAEPGALSASQPIANEGAFQRASSWFEQGDQNLPFFVEISGAIEILRPNGNEKEANYGAHRRAVYERCRNAFGPAQLGARADAPSLPGFG